MLGAKMPSQMNTLISADSDGQVLPAALWRPGRLALCLYMFRGVILLRQDSCAALGGFHARCR
jgi:hypothetical protein